MGLVINLCCYSAFLNGHKKEAPRWVQSIGMEWLFRLCSEPRRLWKRYFKHNPRFIWLFGLQFIKRRLRVYV